MGAGTGVTFADATTQNTAASSFNGTLSNQALVVKDEQGNEVFRVNPDGTSTHTGLETFTGGIVVQSNTSSIFKNAAGTAVFTINPTADPNTQYIGTYNGNLRVQGILYADTKQFVIDHPLDPENKLLHHASIESSELKNLYDGTVVLDDNGEAWVTFPDWFEALNMEFRYQLTPIGASAPSLFIAQEVSDGQFKIAGGPANLKVSWMVTGVRHDTFAREHPMQVEAWKTDNNGAQ